MLLFSNVNGTYSTQSKSDVTKGSKIDSVLTDAKWLLYFRNNFVRKLTVKDIYEKSTLISTNPNWKLELNQLS